MGWLSGWNKRIKLTIDQTKIDTAAQTNFPVSVYLSAASGIGDVDVSCIFDELTSDGNRKKIAITTSDGTTECYVEIERWDDANEKAWLWAKIPSVAYDADTDIYLYYDSDHADNTTYVGDTTDAVVHDVWDANFVVVWHMGQDPNGDVASAIKDSTGNGNDGTPDGSMTSADLVDSKIGKAIDFDGSDDYIDSDEDNSFQLANGTIESCIYLHSYTSGLVGDPLGIASKDQTGWNDDLIFGVGIENGADKEKLSVTIQSSSDSTRYTATDTVNCPLSEDVFTSITWGASGLKLYRNDNPVGSDGYTGGIVSAGQNLKFGEVQQHADRFFDGILDEIRVSDIARSTPWLKATYHSNFDSLITFGSEEIVVINLFDGKCCISPTINLFDGKGIVKDVATDLFDGKSIVALSREDSFDGKARLKDVTTINFDGKVQVKNIATGLFDGKAWLYPARDFFDGKVWVKEFIEGSIDLPLLGITGNTGAIGDVTLPFFEVLGEAFIGVDAQGNITLPSLGVVGFSGANCSYDLPSLGVSGTSVVGTVASGAIVLPMLTVEGQTFTDAIVNGDIALPALRVHATSIAGSICIGEVTLPAIGVNAAAKVGIICTGEVTLPCLIIGAEGGHIPTGDGSVTLPLLQVYATASILADPRNGCHILRHNRWR